MFCFILLQHLFYFILMYTKTHLKLQATITIIIIIKKPGTFRTCHMGLIRLSVACDPSVVLLIIYRLCEMFH